MRTVSFSNKSVRNLLNQEFVNTFTNTTGDPTAGKSIWHSPDDQPGSCARGLGGQNVQTIFMTPAGEIFHAANGFLSGDDLLAEINFAKELFAEIKESPSQAKSLVREAHRERLKDFGFNDEEVEEALSGDPFKPQDLLQGAESGDIFAGKTRREILMGNVYSVKHPMIAYRRFEEDAGELVGKGKSAFVSRSGGNGVTPAMREKSVKDLLEQH